MYDLKIRNAKVLDFDTEEEKICDIGIQDGKIQCVENCSEGAQEEIDATGKVVSPGFIDIHMHEEVIGLSADKDDYDIANKMLLMGATTCVGGNCGNNRQSVEEFFGFIDKHGAPVNYLSAIGHNYLRDVVGNNDRYRKSTAQEIAKMQEIANRAIENGAIGISYGLEYSPGIDFDEATQLCKGIEKKDILLSAHYRKDAKYGIDSVKEMIEISKVTGMSMQISHLGSGTAYGMMKESLDVIQKAINQGVDVMADCYPYDAFSTFIGSAVFDEGCFELWNKSYDSIMLTEEPYVGVRCDKELFYKVRQEHPDMIVVAFVMNDEEIVEAIRAPFMMVASDGLLRKGQGHPRAAGTFPRVLGRYVRDMKALPFMDALKKMTFIPAKRLGLKSKGQVKEGFDADLVIFNPDEIMDGATFENPTLPPKGISHVIVDGKIAVRNNKILQRRLGKVIRERELSK
ncbi:amidohydrolase family protein [Clostridiaceae bacterium 35-E11]